MPPLPPVASVIRVDLIMAVGSDNNARDRIFFRFTGPGPTTADLTTLSTTIANAWGTNLAPLVGPITVLTGLNITDLTSASGAQVVTTQNKPGTRAGSNMTAGISVVVKFKINRRYRGGHPRFYFPGGVVGDLATPQTWTAGYTTAVASGFQAFITASILSPPTNLGALQHENVSYFSGFTNKTFPSGRTKAVPTVRVTPVKDDIVSYSANPKLGSQRRRNLQSP